MSWFLLIKEEIFREKKYFMRVLYDIFKNRLINY